VPGQPTLSDAYAALGLEPGAPMADVKRAYRRLAKSFHPDSAGDAATPRFLAIQAAYDHIRTGRPMPGGTRPPGGPAATEGGAEPWRADPARARAARERARTGRAGSTSGTGTSRSRTHAGAGAGGGARTGTNAGADPGGERGSGRRAGGTGTSTGTSGSSRRRATRKATMGSTSYDEARDHVDATWSGASWYGPSTGEYWIVNPREYADPRKHGPDYQSRARRPIGADPVATAEPLPDSEPSTSGADTSASPGTDPDTPAEAAAPVGARAATGTRPTVRPARAWATAPSGSTSTGAGDRRPDVDPATPAAGPIAWLGGTADDPVRRLGLALVAWPPIGLAAAALIGDATGCSTFAARCDGAAPMLPWLAQAVLLGLLLLLPPVARALAAGTVAVLAALVPLTAVLLALGGVAASQAGGSLVVLLGAAWFVGVSWAVTMRLRLLAGRGGASGARS